MAKKEKISRGGSNGSKGKSPNFCSWQYLIAVGVALLAVVAYSVLREPPKATGAGGGGGPSAAQMEAQLQGMREKMQGIAAGGDTPVFNQIKGMADAVGDVLGNAREAGTEEERRQILQNGLASKTDMLAALSARATKLRAEDEDERRDNAPAPPVSLDNALVSKLTKDSFQQFAAENRRFLVEFYAPWCSHCKKFAPEFGKVAQKFKGQAGFAAVDATAETQLARIYKVSGYPTIMWFVRGRPIDYDGPRTADHLSSWVEERLKPAFAEVDPADDLSAALAQSSSPKSAICAGGGAKDSQLFSAFEAAAEEFRGKLVFVWADGGAESIVFHSKGKSPQACTGKSSGAACVSVEEVVAWLEDALADLDIGDAER